MERTMSVEEKIRRAEEIYERRQQGGNIRNTTRVTVNNSNQKDIKLVRKMIIQIVASLLIYLIIYTIQNNNYVFSQDFIKKINEILSYDINFEEIYNNIKTGIETNMNSNKDNNEEEIVVPVNNIINDNSINTITTIENTIVTNEVLENKINENVIEENKIDEGQSELTQEEQDVVDVKNTTSFIKPLEGEITSRFGERETTKPNITANHTGVDIGANQGTKILSSTEGEVILVSEEGDLGKHLKIRIGDVDVIYAHCNNIYVNEGDKVSQGQEIAEVGSTGNSTGPHLHFEIRINDRLVDPEKILEF